jgi:hypothetical protein
VEKMSMREMYDEDGMLRYHEDRVLRQCLEIKLISKMLEFKIQGNEKI